MSGHASLRKNLEFWHWYPTMLIDGLTREQLRWQPEGHDTSIIFALWHAYRAEDELLHGLVMGQPSIYARDGWADRLPVRPMGATPFGNGATREQIAQVDLDPADVLAYAKAVGESEIAYVDGLSGEEAAAEVKVPFFSGVYPGVDVLSRVETIAFFAIGHTSEHLGEVQFIKGLMGLKGAPL
jgi:hypothetical protein